MIKCVSIVLNPFTNDSRVLKECLSLKKMNYDVTVIALHEGDLAETEFIEGISVQRIKLKTRSWPKNLAVQIIKYMELMSRVLRKVQNVQFIHANDLNALPVAVILKRLVCKNAKIIYDAHEFETEVQGLQGLRKRLAGFTELFFIKFADAVITVSEGIAQEYSKRYNINQPNIVLNCPPLQKVPRINKFREEFNIKQNQTIVLYQGGLNKGRGIELILDAFSKINDNNICLVVMGYGPLEEEVKRYMKEFANIFFHPAVSPCELLQYTASADIGILLYENNCLNHYYCLPNKLFEYTMAGLPVLVSDLAEVRKFISKYKCGFIIQEYSVSGIIDAISKLQQDFLQDYSANARNIAEHFSWESQEKTLMEVYRGLEG